MQLSHFDNRDFERGAPFLLETLWLAIQGLLFSTWLPGSRWRCQLLRLFGAKIGNDVNIKPMVCIKFPWRLIVGNNSWIGERVWIDNLAEVKIGSNVCVSQGAYICTGNHNFRDKTFKLMTAPVAIEDGAWVCAFAKIAPGVTIKRDSVVGLGSVLTEDTEENSIYLGNPAKFHKKRYT